MAPGIFEAWPVVLFLWAFGVLLTAGQSLHSPYTFGLETGYLLTKGAILSQPRFETWLPPPAHSVSVLGALLGHSPLQQSTSETRNFRDIIPFLRRP